MTEAMAKERKKKNRDLPDDFEFAMGTVGKPLAPYFEEKLRKKKQAEEDPEEA